MDNAQKAIMIGVGLFITIIIISSVLLITNMGTDIIDQAGNEVGLMTETLQREMIKQYDGKTIDGGQLLDCIKKYVSSETVAVKVAVKTPEARTLNFGAYLLTLPSGITEDHYKVGGIVGSAGKFSSSGTKKKYTYADALTYVLAEQQYKTAVIYNSADQMLGIAAIEVTE